MWALSVSVGRYLVKILSLLLGVSGTQALEGAQEGALGPQFWSVLRAEADFANEKSRCASRGR
jgi:hypothetical protein